MLSKRLSPDEFMGSKTNSASTAGERDWICDSSRRQSKTICARLSESLSRRHEQFGNSHSLQAVERSIWYGLRAFFFTGASRSPAVWKIFADEFRNSNRDESIRRNWIFNFVRNGLFQCAQNARYGANQAQIQRSRRKWSNRDSGRSMLNV